MPLRESFAFDAHYAQCIIEDNPAAFAMDTYAMGRVVIEPHSLLHGHVRQRDGPRRASGGPTAASGWRSWSGQLGCATYAGTASVTVGSRDGDRSRRSSRSRRSTAGTAAGAAGDSFAFTVFFDPAQAPLNHAIFGPKPTFTGEMVAGEMTIAAPVLRPLLE